MSDREKSSVRSCEWVLLQLFLVMYNFALLTLYAEFVLAGSKNTGKMQFEKIINDYLN